MRTLLPALALGALAVAPPAAARPEPTPRPLAIPSDAIRGVVVGGPDAQAPPPSERLSAVARARVGQKVDLVGHIEAIDGDVITVLGRRVWLEYAEIRGGGRGDLKLNALVKVSGQGQIDGTVEASRVTVQPPRDGLAEARIREVTGDFKEEYFGETERYANPDVQAYVDEVGQRLLPPFVPPNERGFTFTVVADPTPNAFALPDGSIVVHTGLLARMGNEAQLATVLAHELAHVSQRHYVRTVENETSQKLLSIGSLLAQVALSVSGNADAAQGVGLMSSALLSGYSRSFEDEADAVGLRYLFLAGYDVREAPEVWRTFRRFYGDQSPVQNYFYGSHSTSRARESNLEYEIRNAYEPSGLLGGRVATEEFLHRVAPAIRDNALLMAEKGWHGWAEADLRRAVTANPDDPDTPLALADYLMERHGDRALGDALAAVHRSIELDPDNARAQRALGLLYERAGEREGARAAFERALELEPEAAWADALRRRLALL